MPFCVNKPFLPKIYNLATTPAKHSIEDGAASKGAFIDSLRISNER